MPLDEGWVTDHLEKSWGGRLAERILLHSTWAWFPSFGQTNDKRSSSLQAQLDHGGFVPFNDAVEQWVKSESRILHVHNDVELGMFLQAFSEIEFPEVVCPPANPERPLELAQNARYPLDIPFDSESAVPLLPLVNRLISQREFLPFVLLWPREGPALADSGNEKKEAAPERWGPVAGLLKDQGRAIVVARESFAIPPDISRTTLRLGTPSLPKP